MIRDEKLLLRRAARLFNVQTVHYDGLGQRVEPPPEALLSVLRMLGASAESMSDLASALRERRQLLWRMVIDPVTVAWDGAFPRIKLRLPAGLADRPPSYEIVLEGGAVLQGCCQNDDRAAPPQRRIEGINYLARRLTIPEKPPAGYHRLHLTIGNLAVENYLFVAPTQAYSQLEPPAKSWGLFCPLYALDSEKSWGAGDFSALGALVDFAGKLGAHAVATLPLFSAFLDEPFNPSPYAPVSRLFWNEFFLDVNRIAELKRCVAARSIIRSAGFQTEIDSLRAAPLVDYRRAMALKRKVLNELLRCLLRQPSERRAEFERFVATHPVAQDYAAFRAKTDGERKPWQRWEGASRDGTLRPGDYVEHIKQYHLYVQWQADEQMRVLGAKTNAGGPALYLDFPLGVNRDGYDVWRERSAFALDASGGAPPDNFFTKGQDWGFPPLDPEGLRRQGYRYFIHCVRHQLEHAKILRIDHVMGLHRLYWVPDGFAPNEGVYVRYPAEEFYAVLNLESHRHKAQIVGENLGTVPPAVNAAMERHGIRGMYVSQFGVRTEPHNAMDRPGRRTIASLNTHDTPTFAGFWDGADIDDRIALGLINKSDSRSEHGYRAAQRDALASYLRAAKRLDNSEATPAAVLRAWLCVLADSEAEFLLVNLEDLWLEPAPQNVPGTWEERPNWKRKARFSLEQIGRVPGLLDTLRMIDDIRKNAR
jgi:4-alpha-glucanotransferase